MYPEHMKECNSCGKCCIKYSNGGLSATTDDIKYWDIFRPDVAEYVADGKIWMKPDTGEQIELCPWLTKEDNKYLCEIYNDRPEDCRVYPVNIADMINDECEMLEATDYANPQQAQQKLDNLL